MSILWDNPLADIHGAAFLFLYATAIIGLLIYARIVVSNQDKTLLLARLLVPTSPNPYELAYLRSGLSEVLRVALYKLLKLGYIVQPVPLGGSGRQGLLRFEKSINGPDLAKLNPLEQAVVDGAVSSRTISLLFSSPPSSLRDLGKRIEAQLVNDHLLVGPTDIEKAAELRNFAIICILGLGLYKIFAALMQGRHNIGGLIVFAIIGTISAFIVSKPSRITKHGALYLENCRKAFSGFKGYLSETNSDAVPDLVYAGVAVLGIDSLAFTPDAAYARMFRAQYSNDGGGGDSGSGDSGGGGDGGGGCGGGCGG